MPRLSNHHDTLLTVRIGDPARKAFIRLCEENGTLASIEIRAFIERCLRDRRTDRRWAVGERDGR